MLNALDLNNQTQHSADENVITFDKVSKVYIREKSTALQEVSFSVRRGEFVCFIGPSGCGKTTILKLIAKLEQPTTGALTLPDHVSMAFQSGALLPWLTVFDNVAFGIRALHKDERIVKKNVDTYLDMLKLTNFAEKFPSDLSGGQHQRVGIARALAVDPVVLLLDEPFSALDPKITAELHDDIMEVWQATKKTIILVSHSIEEAVSLADRVILMKQGTIKKIFSITLPYPRREQEARFDHHVQEIRKEFFK